MRDSNIGKLHLVATPIGNLSDISKRVCVTLQDVNFIAAEDTRVSRKLLTHLGIKKPLVSYREHNRHDAGAKILARIIAGESCALITDAGTPGISDPGEDLVKLCIDSGVSVVALPGPCAAVCALTLSGLPSGRFVFEGFLPAERKKRLSVLNDLKEEKRTLIFYEAPHKLIRTLSDMKNVFGERRISISRELTKLYEETVRFTIGEAVSYFTENSPRGEFVLVVEGVNIIKDTDISFNEAVSTATALVTGGMSLRDAVKKAALDSGCSRNDLYKALVKEL